MDIDNTQVDAGQNLHYLDNAATTFPKPPEVLNFMIDFCSRACVNPGRSTFDLALEAETVLLTARKKLTELFNGDDPNRLVFGYNATDALNLVIFGMMQKGGHVVSTKLEHNSVLRPIAHCVDDHGAEADFISFDGSGFIDPEDIRKAIRPETKLVVVNHGSNVIGTVQPVAEVGAICKEAGVTFCVDAAQTAGMFPIDMQAMNIDIIAFTGHKSLLGPTGIGGLCVREGVEIGHSRAGGTGVASAVRRHLDMYPFRMEYGTPNMVGIAGLLEGVKYIERMGGVEKIHKHEMELARPLWECLRETEGIKLYCADTLENRTPVFSFNIEGFRDPAEIGARLDVDYDVACRTGLQCAPLCHETIGTAPDGTVRLSLGPMSTEDDVAAAIPAVRELAAEKR